jgi:hypothetical protein
MGWDEAVQGSSLWEGESCGRRKAGVVAVGTSDNASFVGLPDDERVERLVRR